ncbi:hypothetical protein HWV62_16412 [Athelia sp. TMB]|nr:hypothetical protein HWV62_16412 [Athelia sp. TMB]
MPNTGHRFETWNITGDVRSSRGGTHFGGDLLNGGEVNFYGESVGNTPAARERAAPEARAQGRGSPAQGQQKHRNTRKLLF